jgi:hypothetical protein
LLADEEGQIKRKSIQMIYCILGGNKKCTIVARFPG